ncbi:hypothetical protein K1719_042281 [Acacia pycnantha]|nr:hypothetical protein K1719_042281 [Acacia pycnantha]
MASPVRIAPIFCFCSLLLIAISDAYLPLPLRNLPLRSGPSIHDLLAKYGLPKGILPDSVKSFSLSDDGSFRVELQKPCYVQFDRLVYYDTVITGKLTYGSVSDVSGIQAQKLFLWLPVTGIKANEKSEGKQFTQKPCEVEYEEGVACVGVTGE